jgi:hypothetical protein
LLFLVIFTKTPHPSAELTPSPQGEGLQNIILQYPFRHIKGYGAQWKLSN